MVDCLNEHHGVNFSAYQGDCVSVLSQLPDACIDFSVYSPPFGSLFVYSESAADMGNSTDEEFAAHYGYLVKEKFRLTKPGRLTAVHCSDLPMTKWKDGAVGIKDFSGDIIRIHQDAGWIMHSRRTIWKCPVVEMTRTKHVGLLYKQLQKDSSKSRGGMPDYLITFIKPGDNASPIKHTPEDFPLDQWQEWASPVWMSVDQSNVLNVQMAREQNDERHLCVAEGSFVLTRERGYIPIETIACGDRVLTHMGRWKKVIGVACNGERDVIKTEAQGVPHLLTTPDHKVWTRRGRTKHPRAIAMKSDPEWMQAHDTLGSYLNLPLPPIEPSILTPNEWWIVGRWLGDGHRSGHRTSGTRSGGFGQFVISCAHGEAAALVARLGIHAGHQSRVTATQIVLVGMRGELRDVLRRCGEGAQNKSVPAEALCLDREHSEALLQGYLSADGHYVAKHDRYMASSVSRALALGMAMVAQRARGVVASVYAGRPARKGTICGRDVNMRQDWILAYRNSDGYKKSGWIGDDGAWKKVRKISPAGVTRVWDLKVEDDHSFVAEGAVVHNCPLQLDVIERAVVMWSNPGEVVLSPFMGIGSEGYQSLKLGRRFMGTELKQSYFRQACKNLDAIDRQASLFDAVTAA